MVIPGKIGGVSAVFSTAMRAHTPLGDNCSAVRVTSVEINNYRAIESAGPFELGSVNVLIGPNNAGKSSLIRALYLMQEGSQPVGSDVRLGATAAEIRIGLEGIGSAVPWQSTPGLSGSPLVVRLDVNGNLILSVASASTGTHQLGQLPGQEPHHFLVPYLSKRKASSYVEDVRLQYATNVGPSFTYLAAKLSRLGNPAFPGNVQYAEACQDILGFVVTAVPSVNGQQPGVFVSRTETIPIQAMGEGVPNIVGLLADLALAEEKLFLIEELENDLHPTALKALLQLIVDSSGRNQFIVSTHSNIVARYLGAAPDSRLFYVDAERGALPPLASIREVGPNPSERMAIMRELGYELNDFNLWDGWIFLEESSAERIIRDYLIPWFAPRLVQRVRTISAGGSGNVGPTFEDFNRLVRFTHLEPAYRGRAWVLVDGDDVGMAVIASLRERYGATWDSSRLYAFREPDFEAYYPERFAAARKDALTEMDRWARREKKRVLLEEVRDWIELDREQAKGEFRHSAGEVIGLLRQIEAELFGPDRPPVGSSRGHRAGSQETPLY